MKKKKVGEPCRPPLVQVAALAEALRAELIAPLVPADAVRREINRLVQRDGWSEPHRHSVVPR